MIITCKKCHNTFPLNKSEAELTNELIRCQHCNVEFVYESKSNLLESRLIELGEELKKKEKNLIEQNTDHSEKIAQLEKNLIIKKEELDKQETLEKKIILFEQRITDTERLNSQQADLELKRNKLENEVKKTLDNISIKNKSIEKKTNYLEMKINPYENINEINNQIAVNEINNDVVDLKTYDQKEMNKKKESNSHFFWKNKSDK